MKKIIIIETEQESLMQYFIKSIENLQEKYLLESNIEIYNEE